MPKKTAHVDVGRITLAGEQGRKILDDLRDVSTGALDVENAAAEISRRPDGMLAVKVSNETVDLISGAADL